MANTEKPHEPRVLSEFKPAQEFKKLYYIYLAAAYCVFVLTWYIPMLLAPRHPVAPFLSVPLLSVLAFVIYWIPRYYDSMHYRLTENEMTWRRGVWFRNTGIVPYDRITNIDITQGPLSRMLGIASLRIQTAGYSAAPRGLGGSAEISIEGVKNFEEIRSTIMGFVRGKKQSATGVYPVDAGSGAANELVEIRKLLEKILGKL